MRVALPTAAHYTIIGTRIVDQFIDNLPNNIQRDWYGFVSRTIEVKGVSNEGMDWERHNVRYGASKSVPGSVGEMIAIHIVQLLTKSTLFRLYESKPEQTGGLDFCDLNADKSYQVKAIRTINNRIGLDRSKIDITNPKADFLMLIDIDDHTAYCLPKAELKRYLSGKPEVSFSKYRHGQNYVGWNCDVSELVELSILPTNHVPFYTKPDIHAVSTEDVKSLW